MSENKKSVEVEAPHTESKPAPQTEAKSHTVVEGDTVRSIALQNGVDQNDLMRLNDIGSVNAALKEDQKVNLGFVPDPEDPLEVSASGLDGLLSGDEKFDTRVLVIQHELASIGLLDSKNVTGVPNRATVKGWKLFRQVLSTDQEDNDFNALNNLSTSRNAFRVVE